MAPDWLSRATLPGRAMSAAKLALRLLGGWMTPRQFGPMMRILPRASVADLPLQLAALGAQLGEAGRDDDGGRDAAVDALAG